VQKKGLTPVRGYFVRAKVFGFMIMAVVVFAILYYFYEALLG
jgi:hypothetical protein